MARKKARKVQSGGYSYSVSPNNPQVGCRRVAPRGSTNRHAHGLSPDTEEGKRRAGYRLEWIIFSVLLLILFYSVLTAGTSIVLAGQ
jgi:hypothetical protein